MHRCCTTLQEIAFEEAWSQKRRHSMYNMSLLVTSCINRVLSCTVSDAFQGSVEVSNSWSGLEGQGRSLFGTGAIEQATHD